MTVFTAGPDTGANWGWHVSFWQILAAHDRQTPQSLLLLGWDAAVALGLAGVSMAGSDCQHRPLYCLQVWMRLWCWSWQMSLWRSSGRLAGGWTP